MNQNSSRQSYMQREMALQVGLRAPIKDMLLIDRITGNLYSATDGNIVPKIQDISEISPSYFPNHQFIAHIHNSVEMEMSKAALNDPLVKAIKQNYLDLFFKDE